TRTSTNIGSVFFGECEWCKRALPLNRSPRSRSHLLSCGHVLCEGCRGYARDVASEHIRCPKCGLQRHSFILPATSESTPSAHSLEVNPAVICDQHLQHAKWTCSCGEGICAECALSAHASHFQYAALFEVSTALDEEMNRMSHLKQLLIGEKMKIKKEKLRIDKQVVAASEEIAAKFMRIIAQAISRCLDLAAQIEKVGKTRHRELDVQMECIDAKLSDLNKAVSMGNLSKQVTNLCTSLCVKRAAIAMSKPLRSSSEQSKASTAEVAPVLKLSFSQNVLEHIASIGRLILTNLVDQEKTMQEVATLPTPVVTHKQITTKSSDLQSFIQYHKMLLCCKWMPARGLLIPTNDPALQSIGLAAAFMVVAPPPPHLIQLEAASTTNQSNGTSNRTPRYRFVKRMTGGAHAGDGTAALNEMGSISSTRREKLSINAPINLDHEPIHIDAPYPFSPKRIKMEEEEGIDGSNHMENLMNFAEDCEKAVKYEEMDGYMGDEVKREVDSGGD
ncbi:hypothetical protein PFISCL1PPCAC_21555, partial [Pristionchus fissidentatus]